MLDGNGVPCDFFADVHIRKAFAYAFDYDTYLKDVFLGEAVQPVTLALAGMAGFDPNAAHYNFDLDKAAEEFKLADLIMTALPPVMNQKATFGPRVSVSR